MKHKFQLDQRKGQSAIEYLMTYGWMLLVVAIVGGAIFATVQGQQGSCDNAVPMSLDATQQGFGVSQFGPEAGNTQLVLENNNDQRVDITTVELTVAGTDYTLSGPASLTIGESGTWSTSSTGSASGCNEVDVSIQYDSGQLTGQWINGTMEAQIS